MTTAFFYALVSVVIVSIISLIGVVTLSFKEEKLRKALLYLVSFSAGALLGDVFIHLIPEYVHEYEFSLSAGIAVLGGIVIFFILEQVIQWHHHHSLDCGKDPACEHERVHAFAITNLVGDTLHNFLDGIVIAAAYLLSIPAGIATTIAVIFHEIPQEIGDFGVLIHGGFSKMKAIWFNLLTALTAIIGVLVAFPLGERVEGASQYLIPLTIGGFIYIAGADLIPEVHKGQISTKAAILHLLAFLLGIAAMLLVLVFEVGHNH